MTSQFVSCPDCRCLVLDTAEERREHRAADRQDRQVLESIRRVVRAASDDAASALQLVRDLQRDLEGLDGRVREASDTPEPDLVVVGTWPEDELDDGPEQQSQYVDDALDDALDDGDDTDPDDEPTSSTSAVRHLTPTDYFTGGIA